jgi:hypothetical protein
MLKMQPALATLWLNDPLTVKWVGVYAQILKASTPLHIRKIAGALHNRRQHNASPSGLSDLTRKYMQIAIANFDSVTARIALDTTATRTTPDRCYILTAEQVWTGFFESAYNPDGAVKAATTDEAYESVVCCACLYT